MGYCIAQTDNIFRKPGCFLKSLIPFKNCAVFAGIFGILQSIFWIILTFIIIEYCTRKLDYTGHNDHWAYFYLSYLRKRSQKPFVMTLMYMELALSVIWLIFSILLVKVAISSKVSCQYSKVTKVTYTFWALVTFLICLTDLIACGKLVVDNVNLLSKRPIECTTPTTTPTTTTTTTRRPRIDWCQCGCGCNNSYNPNKTTTTTTTTTTTVTTTSINTTTVTTPRQFEGRVIKPVFLAVLLVQSRFVFIWILNLACASILFAGTFVHLEYEPCLRCDPKCRFKFTCGKSKCTCGKPKFICRQPKPICPPCPPTNCRPRPRSICKPFPRPRSICTPCPKPRSICKTFCTPIHKPRVECRPKIGRLHTVCRSRSTSPCRSVSPCGCDDVCGEPHLNEDICKYCGTIKNCRKYGGGSSEIEFRKPGVTWKGHVHCNIL